MVISVIGASSRRRVEVAASFSGIDRDLEVPREGVHFLYDSSCHSIIVFAPPDLKLEHFCFCISHLVVYCVGDAHSAIVRRLASMQSMRHQFELPSKSSMFHEELSDVPGAPVLALLCSVDLRDTLTKHGVCELFRRVITLDGDAGAGVARHRNAVFAQVAAARGLGIFADRWLRKVNVVAPVFMKRHPNVQDPIVAFSHKVCTAAMQGARELYERGEGEERVLAHFRANACGPCVEPFVAKLRAEHAADESLCEARSATGAQCELTEGHEGDHRCAPVTLTCDCGETRSRHKVPFDGRAWMKMPCCERDAVIYCTLPVAEHHWALLRMDSLPGNLPGRLLSAGHFQYGLEYECASGHRWMLDQEGVSRKDVPVFARCSTSSHKPLARLAKIHIMTPSVAPMLVLAPLLEHYPFPCPVSLPPSSYCVVRLPYFVERTFLHKFLE